MQLQPLRCSPWPRSWKRKKKKSEWYLGIPKFPKSTNNSTHSNTGKFHHSTILPPDPKKAYSPYVCAHQRSAPRRSFQLSHPSHPGGKLRTLFNLKPVMIHEDWRTSLSRTIFFVFHSRYLYFRHCQWWRFPGLLPFLSNNCFPKPLQFLQVHKSSSSSSEWNFWNLLIKSWMFSLPVFCKREGGEPVIHK